MSLLHLRTFLEVYRRRSLTVAARGLALTQPAVSQQMASLEQQLGRRLFERTRRGVVPTAAADELASALGGSLDHAEAVLAAARVRSPELSGVVHLAGPAEYIGEQFVQALTRLTQAGVELRVRLGGRDAIYTQLIAGDVDLAVTASLPDHRQLDARPIASERMVLVAPAGEAFGGDPQTLLGHKPFCAYDLELPLIRQWCEANGLPLPGHPPGVVIPDLRTLVRFVASGAGWSVLPDYLIERELEADAIRDAGERLQRPRNQLYLVWAKGSLRHPRVARTRDLLLSATVSVADNESAEL